LRLTPIFSDPHVPHLLMYERLARMAQRFDVIHLHTDVQVLPVARRLPAPCLMTLHGRLDLPDLPPLYREYAEMPLVSISESQRRPLWWANWAGTVLHGLPMSLYAPRLRTERYLAFIGRISAEKRLDLAIRIAQSVGIDLLIAAKVDAADRVYYEQVIKPLLVGRGVHFIGEITDADKAEFLGGAMALLFPIDWPEPFGLVMIEAMACGTPVIAFRRGSVPEVIDDGVSGIIVDSVEEAIAAVHRLDALPREGVRRRFEQRFTAARMAQDYTEVYERLLRPRGSRIAGLLEPAHG
jgi:glycosyltransferase involved in cell wall biosynthesis